MENKNDVMGAVMHLQRAMKRGNKMSFTEKPGCGHHGEGHGCGHHGEGHGMGHGCGHHGKGHGMGKGCGRHKPNFAAGRLISALNQSGSMTTGELAEALDLRPSSLSELLGKLEARELVIRTQDENDKRIYHVSLTDSAKQLEEKIAEEREARLAIYSACFTEEEAAAFCALCEKLSKHLEALAEVK